MSLDVLYDQGPCLVVLKPAGLATQAPPGIDSLESRVREWYRSREAKTGNLYLGVPHRLDRAVSGAVVFARHVRAARRLSEQFEKRTVRKIYWAAVEGRVTPSEGEWRDRMAKVPEEARAEIVDEANPLGKEAWLSYRSIGGSEHGSFLEIELGTGRMHQIRVQASSRGFPILGDALYGSKIGFGPETPDARQRAIALHGRRLCFLHPMTREPVDIEAPLPKSWEKLGLE